MLLVPDVFHTFFRHQFIRWYARSKEIETNRKVFLSLSIYVFVICVYGSGNWWWNDYDDDVVEIGLLLWLNNNCFRIILFRFIVNVGEKKTRSKKKYENAWKRIYAQRTFKVNFIAVSMCEYIDLRIIYSLRSNPSVLPRYSFFFYNSWRKKNPIPFQFFLLLLLLLRFSFVLF